PLGLREWLVRLGTVDGPCRDQTLVDSLRSVVLTCFDIYPAGQRLLRFRGIPLLGTGESGNWPGATKAVSEWFPKRESGLATALFDSGSSIGGAISPYLVVSIFLPLGRGAAFIISVLVGFSVSLCGAVIARRKCI